MRYQEYERRRRALEQQLQADLDLVRAAYAVKFRSLETVWLASPDQQPSVPPVPPPSETVPEPLETVQSEPAAPETVASATVEIETRPEEPPPPVLPIPEPPRQPRRGETLSDIRDALPGLPDLFEKEDVYRALGYKPPRATLYRAFLDLLNEKEIAIDSHSMGGRRTRYRKLSASRPEMD